MLELRGAADIFEQPPRLSPAMCGTQVEVSIKLLGVPTFCVDGVALDVFKTQQAKRLFCYLALNANRPHSREIVSEALWGDRTPAQANRTLRSELYRLRKGIAAQNEEAARLLVSGATTVQLNTHAVTCHVDILDFQRLGTSAAAQPVELLSGEQADALRSAAALYVAPLMVDFYEDWCLFERQRLHELHMEVLGKLMALETRDGRYAQAIDYGNRILAEEPLMESVHRQVMRLHYNAGNRAAALRQFETCKRLLQEELGVEPMRRTRRIHELILADRIDSIAATGPSEPDEPGPTSEPSHAATGERDAGENARLAADELMAATELLRKSAGYLSELSDQLSRAS
jgi:DNA-binding SARP family transcriptional activator